VKLEGGTIKSSLRPACGLNWVLPRYNLRVLPTPAIKKNFIECFASAEESLGTTVVNYVVKLKRQFCFRNLVL
jgi:hypothetical protein